MPAQEALLSPDHRAPDQEPPPEAGLSAIRLLALPELGPPFDDDPRAPAGAPAAGGSALGADRPVSGGLGYAAGPADPGATAGQAAERDWAPRFALLLTEALSGARPARQVQPWTTERARAHLARLMPLFSGGQRPRVLRVITTRPSLDVIEMTAVVCVGARTRALAVRLERSQLPGATAPRWLCTDIEAA